MYLRKILFFAFFIAFLLAASTMEAATPPAFSPFPKAADGYWRKQVPKAMRRDYVRLGESYRGKTWAKIPDSVFAEFRTTGNRTNYEDSCFARRCQFSCLVMAEVMDYRGRFLPDICRGLHYFLEAEPWWGLPAHYPKSAPASDIQVVDLFNAETASMLAWTIYMLGGEIDNTERGLTKRVRSEIERRFILPTLNEPQGWMHNANNWNTWITSNFIECALVCLPSGSSERTKALRVAEACLQLFIKGYPDDGGCEEGVGYWDRAGASFFESIWMLRAAEPSLLPSDNRCQLTPEQQKKVAAMGRFITTMHIGDLAFVNFSDAKVQNVPNINILFPYGVWLKGQADGRQMMQFAAYVAKKYDYLSKPSFLFLQSGNWPTLSRELMLLSMLPQLRKTPAAQPHTTDAWLANSQIMVAATDCWFVAAKGGHNNESHNHNDVGSFVVYSNGAPVLIDLGRDTYTSQTFSSRRFELMNNRSLYHNVPLINGCEQHDGKEYKAVGAEHTANDTASILTLDIAKAYPKEAGAERWRRSIVLNRKRDSVEVTEDFRIVKLADRPTEITLMCYGEPRMLQLGRVALAGGAAELVYDSGSVEATWTKVKMNDGIMKTQWKDNVYRLVLKNSRGSESGMMRYWLERK